MGDLEFLFALLLVAAALVRLGDAVAIPYPIAFVCLGVAVGFVPSLPDVEVDPHLVLLIFLPPLLMSAGYWSSPQEIRVETRAISFLALALVAATMALVAVVAHALIGQLSWAGAFVLGAVVAPTDPVAAAATFSRMGVPGRIALIVETESMVNDAAALVFFRTALTALTAGTFSVLDAGFRTLGSAAGGIAIGVVAGFALVETMRRLEDNTLAIALTILVPYGAYVLAEKAGVSGVLASVVVGVYLGWNAHRATDAETRLQARAFWQVLVFGLEAVLFLLLGLQLPVVYDAPGLDASALVGSALIISLLVVAVRLGATFVPFVLSGTPWRERVAIGWSGMRGAISLAAALSVPLGATGRPEIVFVVTIVIVVTLVGQGVTLAPLLRALRLRGTRGWTPDEAIARLETAQAALDRLDELEQDGWPENHVQRMRDLYEARFRACQAVLEGEGRDGDPSPDELRLHRYSDLRRDLIGVERDTLVDLRDERRLGQDVLRRVERDLDLEETRLGGVSR